MLAQDPYAWPRPSEPRAVQHTRGNPEFGRPGKGEGLASELVGAGRRCRVSLRTPNLSRTLCVW
jgi:hypothetical protein